MKKVTIKTLYPLIIVLVVITVGVAQRIAQHQTQDAALKRLMASPYWEPWENHGVYCQSELDLQDPRIPFTYSIIHPPGDRELVNETVRRLVRTGAKPQPWPEASLYRFQILRTTCYESWTAVYGKLRLENRRKVDALLEGMEHPTEADYRKAILQCGYEDMGTVDAALEWYPPAEE